MPKTEFDIFVGNVVVRAEAVHDYFQLEFSKGMIVNIFNRFTLIPSESIAAELIGANVEDIEVTSVALTLIFNQGMRLEIGFNDADFKGPEGLEVIAEDGSHIVW